MNEKLNNHLSLEMRSMMARSDAWAEVYMQLLKGNPDFPQHGKNGVEAALNEIKRLQGAAK